MSARPNELPGFEMCAALSRSIVPLEHFLQRALQMIEVGDYATTEATIDTWAPAVAAITASAKGVGRAGPPDGECVQVSARRPRSRPR